MEALFESAARAHRWSSIGQPDVPQRKIDNPIVVPKMLSFLTYRRWEAEVRGPQCIPARHVARQHPAAVLRYHIMVGLGTIFIAIMVVAAFLLWRGSSVSRALDALGAAAELAVSVHREHRGLDDGRNRTPALAGLRADAHRRWLSPRLVSAGNGLFTLLGFMGMYTVLGILFLFLVRREIENGTRRIGRRLRH